MLKKIVIIVMMLIHSVTDIKYKKVMEQLIFVGIVIGGIFQVADMYNGTWQYSQIWALLPGIIFLILAKITQEAIGYGDGMMVLMLGVFYHLENLCEILMGACMFAVIAALVFLIIFQKNRKYEIPFVPFLTIALLVEELCG